MDREPIRVLLISSFGPGLAETRDVAPGTAVGTFVSRAVGVPLDDVLIRVNRHSVPLDHALQDGDRVTVTPTGIRGEVWVPSLRDFKRYLRTIGFELKRTGKGDHEIWQGGSGQCVTVNPSSRDRKSIDIASVHQLARLLVLSFAEMIAEIMEWLNA